MSERATRKNQARIIEERLKHLRKLREEHEQEEQALVIAQAAVIEEPRQLVTCQVVLEYVALSSWKAERAHCSECESSFDGWTPEYRFCPLCGSQINSIQREHSPQERLTRSAVKDAMAVFTK